MKEEKTPEYNYAELDEGIRFHYKRDLLEAIEGHGFEHVSQYVHHSYFRHENPVSEIANNLPITPSAVFAWMRRWEFPLRQRGGNTKNKALKDERVIKKIMDLKGVLSIVETAEACGCSPTSVLKLWKRGAA